METRDIRLSNLLDLSSGYGKIVDFCRKVGMNPSYYSQIKSGKKAIGDDIARKVERALGLDRGYLDTPKNAGPVKQPFSNSVDNDVMAIAYSIQSLPNGLRDQLQRMVHQIAAHCQTTVQSKDVGGFNIVFEEGNGGHRVQKARSRSR